MAMPSVMYQEENNKRSEHSGPYGNNGFEHESSWRCSSLSTPSGFVPLNRNCTSDDGDGFRNIRRRPHEIELYSESGEHNWEVPNAAVSQGSADPIRMSNLQFPADQASQWPRMEGGGGRREIQFNPPNAPIKDALEYLKELAVAEARRINLAPAGCCIANAPRYGLYVRPPSLTQKPSPRRLSSEHSTQENMPPSPGCGAPSAVKSFNDFDEGIFVYNERTDKYSCPDHECSKEFPSLSRIKRHYITHTDIKPFKCKNKECKRTFSRKDNMLQHYRVHCPYTAYHH